MSTGKTIRTTFSALLLSSALSAMGCGGGPDEGSFLDPTLTPDSGVTAAPIPDTGVPAPVLDSGGPVATPGGLGGPGGGRSDSSVLLPVDSGTPVGSGTPADGGALGGRDAGTDGGGTGGGNGDCCPDGNCLCHGPAPTALTSDKGPFMVSSFTISTGKVDYPSNATPPFAVVAICPGFTNTGPEMEPWGQFYASHGIVTIVTNTGGSDSPDVRATKLLAALKELKDKPGALMGKLSDRFGTSGYSMGGGGTTIATTKDMTLKTSVGLAAYGPATSNVKTPTLLLCGASDTTAPCSMAQGAYGGIMDPTPKMMIQIPGATHFSWFGPTNAGMGMSGQYALAFQKVYLEGDTRWKPLLLKPPTGGGMMTTSIK